MRPAVLLAVAATACTSRAPSTAAEVRRIADDVIPRVEASARLTFRTPPNFGVRTRDEVERYLRRRIDEEYPAERMEHVTAAYRRFGVIPDTLDVRALLLAVLAEQVVGYYDPDSSTLYVVDGTDPAHIRLVLAHELVHALQHQYLPLDSILRGDGPNDERMAAQAVLEGQAMVASLAAILDERQFGRAEDLWRNARQDVRRAQEQMPVLAEAPLIVREGLLFPYLAGADFVHWFVNAHPDTQPYGPRLPRSTEQILHPERYGAGDAPTPLALERSPAAGEPLYEDNWGEFETRIVLQELTGSESLGTAGALGWDGDWFALYDAGGDADAVVWWSVWDNPAAAERFAALLERHWPNRSEPGRRWRVDRDTVGGMPGVRLVDAPDAWPGWERLPRAQIR
jgi:hypothetical protein